MSIYKTISLCKINRQCGIATNYINRRYCSATVRPALLESIKVSAVRLKYNSNINIIKYNYVITDSNASMTQMVSPIDKLHD